ncbi:MAG: hypothetical protein IPO77_03285 [Acidobacteria bacterium]|nr:hypothetical protein [Acidobacteriota bacterium]
MLADLPAGRHVLTLSYEIKNRGEKIARVVSAISWPAFVISAIGLWFRNREEAGEHRGGSEAITNSDTSRNSINL